MDGDVFGRVTRLGRAAAEAVARAIGGESWDPFYAERCIDDLIVAAGGIPSLIVVVGELGALRDAPLLARFQREDALRRIREATHASGSTELDLILRSSAERLILRGEFRLGAILERFFGQLLERSVLTGRGGFMEQYGSAKLDDARAVLVAVACVAAAALEARPTAKRLGLARPHAALTAETNLLGGM